MRIVLIYPWFLEDRIHDEDIAAVPIGLYYVGAALREAGYPVEILDWHGAAGRRRHMERTLRALAPDVIGLSILHANRWGGIEVARLARRLNPRVRVVFGGVGATFLWKHFLTHFPEVDYVVCGEGETTFLSLVDWLAGRGKTPPERLRGLALRAGGRPVRNPDVEPVRELDRLPDPSRHFTFRHVALTRGCPGHCTFCGSPQFWGPGVRAHSAEAFVGQVARLHRRGVNFFFVSDDTFTIDRRRVIAACRRLAARSAPVSWAAISRVDCVDEEMLLWMRRAGCIQVSYGVESGSAAIRQRLAKRIDEDQVRRAFALTQRCGLMARAYFIYGCPGESEETIDETLALIEAIRPLGAIFYLLDIFPGTALYADYKRRCGVDDDIWLERVEGVLYYQTDPRLSKEKVLSFGRRLRETYYRRLPAYAREVELADSPELAPLHADFLSRLALTFHQGEYARDERIPERGETAAALYRRALTLHPDARAFLGLGMLRQDRGDIDGALRVLERGRAHFPDHLQLAVCLAVACMNRGAFDRARSLLEPLAHLPEAAPYLAACRRETGG